MAFGGGTSNDGVIFKFNPTTKAFKVLHDFDNTHGEYPYGNLTQLGSITTGIASLPKKDFNISPNPTGGGIRITSTDKFYILRVTNSLGTVLISCSPVGANYSLDLSRLQNGVYFITAISNTDTYTKELVVNR